jgi:hypothetical protein
MIPSISSPTKSLQLDGSRAAVGVVRFDLRDARLIERAQPQESR